MRPPRPRLRKLAITLLALPAAAILFLTIATFIWQVLWTQPSTPARQARGELPDARFQITRGSFHYFDDRALERYTGGIMLGYPTDEKFNVLTGWHFRRVPNPSLAPDFATVFERGNLKFPLLIPAAILALPPLAYWFFTRPRKPGHCAKCNYNRAGLKPDAPCPECGHTP